RFVDIPNMTSRIDRTATSWSVNAINTPFRRAARNPPRSSGALDASRQPSGQSSPARLCLANSTTKYMSKSHEKTSPTDIAGLGPSAKQRMANGKKLRERVPRSSQAEWKPSPNRRDPVHLLKHADRGRLEALLPIRYARMKQSPFGFFRGSAALMAADLSTTPSTGLRVQACGDCHIANFGGFGSPERRLVFDINDFDETLPAPWGWGVKRLGGGA